MRDQARFQEEMERRKSMEDQLRAQASQAQQGPPVGEGDLAEQVDRLQKIEQRQRQEINRYTKRTLYYSYVNDGVCLFVNLVHVLYNNSLMYSIAVNACRMEYMLCLVYMYSIVVSVHNMLNAGCSSLHVPFAVLWPTDSLRSWTGLTAFGK